jgi:hypothetical protein
LAGSLIPGTDNTSDIGSASLRWRDLYALSAKIDNAVLPSTGLLAWAPGSDLTAAPDTILVRGAGGNALGIRNGTTAQAFWLYNTYTDGANWERLTLRFLTNYAFIQVEQSGSGVQRGMILDAAYHTFRTAGSPRFDLDASGFYPNVDNVVDVGYPTQRVRTLYAMNANFSNRGAAPSSSADEVKLCAVDISAGNCTLGIRTEAPVIADVSRESTHSLVVNINGTNYRILLSDAPFV